MGDFTASYSIGREILTHQRLEACAQRAMADELHPIRLAASYKGQSNLPGFFWMSRMDCLLMYESKLEMLTLLQLDFNVAVEHVVPQPFELTCHVDPKSFRHTPDFFVRYNNQMGEVINVKPKKYVGTERNKRSFDACREAANEMGFGYTTRSEPERCIAANLWWLGGYRRLPPRISEYSEFLLRCAEESMTIGEISRKADIPSLVRPVLFHFLWKGILQVDLNIRMRDSTIVSLPKGKFSGE